MIFRLVLTTSRGGAQPSSNNLGYKSLSLFHVRIFAKPPLPFLWPTSTPYCTISTERFPRRTDAILIAKTSSILTLEQTPSTWATVFQFRTMCHRRTTQMYPPSPLPPSANKTWCCDTTIPQFSLYQHVIIADLIVPDPRGCFNLDET